MFRRTRFQGDLLSTRPLDKRSSRQSFPGPRWNDSGHTIRLQKIVEVLLHNGSATAGCVPHERAVTIAHNDPAMKHIEMLAGGRKENEITAVKLPDQLSNRPAGYAREATLDWTQARH